MKLRNWLTDPLPFLFVFIAGHYTHTYAELLSDCSGIQSPNINASSTTSISGFSLPGSLLPSSTWTFGTTISESRSSSGKHYITQDFYINTKPTTNFNSSNLPYAGGVAILSKLAQSVPQRSLKDPGDCSKLLDQKCIQALIKEANTTALGYSGKAQSSESQLSALSSTLPAECVGFALGKGGWDIPISSQFISPPSNPLIYAIDCPVSTAAAPASSKGSTFLRISPVPTPENTSDDSSSTVYDEWVERISPIIVSVWRKGDKISPQPWADSRLICLRAKDITKGSRIPNEIARGNNGIGIDGLGSSAVRRRVNGGCAFALVVLAAVMILL